MLSPSDRLLRRARRIEERIEGRYRPVDLTADGKPKWMPWATYDRLRGACADLHVRSLAHSFPGMRRLLERYTHLSLSALG